MAVAPILLRTNLNISRISGAVFNTNKTLDESGKAATTLGQTLLKRNVKKREAIKQDKLLFIRRREAVRRKDQESVIEASGIGGAVKRQANVIAESTKGFLGRIMDFVGTLLVGWLVNNLPTIIGLAQELIARIQKFVEIMGSFVNNTFRIFKTFGDTLGAIYTDVSRFDITFTNTRSQVEKSMNELDDAFSQLNRSFDEALRLFTTPFTTEEGEGAYSEQPIPETGSQWGGEETMSGGKVLNPQAGYSYLRQLGVSHTHSLGILANIKGESGFRIDADENGRGTAGIGLFQYTFPARKQAFLQAVPDWKTNWKGQIDYAIKNDANTPLYLRKQFSSPEEAADDFMRNWENPSPRVYVERRRKHNDFIRSFRPSGRGAQVSSQPRQGITTTVRDEINVSGPRGGTPTVGLTPGQGFGAARRGGRRHEGIDIGTSGQRGYYVALRKSGRVVFSAVAGGYGITVDIIGPDGTCYRFAHLAKSLVRVGQTYNGQTIGEIGNTGNSPDVHLHFEVRPGGPYGRAIDPRPYLRLLAIGRQLTGQAGQPAQVATPTPAQISPSQRRAATPEELATERRGPVIIFTPPAPQMPQMPSAQGMMMSLPDAIPDTLNRYITQKLLLELAYT